MRSRIRTRAGRILAWMAFLLVPRIPGAQVAVEAGSPMRYLASSSDPGLGPTWTAETFDDSTWPTGEYGVGYEDATGAAALLRTTVPVQTASVYTRSTFTVTAPATLQRVFLGADWDDGYAAWINGVEVFRSPELPAGPLDWDTVSASHESSNAAAPRYRPIVDVTTAALPALRAGVNVLAVGAWNDGIPSSDLVLVPRLSFDDPLALVRGPYLQRACASAVVLRWRTNVPDDSRVRWGDAPTSLSSVVDVPGSRTEHEVELVGLEAGRTYAYSVGSSTLTLAGPDTNHLFTMPPAPADRSPMRLWVLGDSGTGFAAAARVRDAYLATSSAAPPTAVLMLGDNAYENGTDADFQAGLFDMFAATMRRSAVWPAMGNHDARGSDSPTQSGPFYVAFSLPTAAQCGGAVSGTEAYWSFDLGNVHFVCLDSADSNRADTAPMATWLRADLASTSQDWVIAYFHHPPYSRGSHDSDTEVELVDVREIAVPILEAGGVDLVLCGHSHAYERTTLIDGHHDVMATFGPQFVLDGGDGRPAGDGPYGKPSPGRAQANEGAVFVVAGSSAKLSGGPFDHPAMEMSLLDYGSLALDVDGLRADVRFIDDDGVVRDHFALVKGCLSPCVERDCIDGLDDEGDGAIDCADDDCAGIDSDGDLAPDCVDCVPRDASTWALPDAVEQLDVASPRGGATADLAWTDIVAGALTVAHDVVLGSLRELWSDRDLTRAACLADDLGTPTLPHDAAPGPAEGWWYLVRADGPCGPGPLGAGSLGPRAVPALPCD